MNTVELAKFISTNPLKDLSISNGVNKYTVRIEWLVRIDLMEEVKKN